jgi:hypothetical protein
MSATVDATRLLLACQPGRDGIPDSLPGRVLCGQYGIDTGHLWHQITGHVPFLLAALLAVIAARIAQGTLRMLAWWHPKTPPRWLEITPPVTATPGATLALWRLLAAVLPAAKPWTMVPAHLVWEIYATRHGTRCGLWVPPDVPVNAVRGMIQRAWPGARVTDAAPPDLPATGPVAALRLATTQPDWMPLLDDDTLPTTRSGVDVARGVYGGLTSAGRMRAGWLQIIITRAPAHRRAVLEKATRDPARAGRHRVLRGLLFALRWVASVMRAVLDLVGPSHAHASAGSGDRYRREYQRSDPWLVEQRRQARIRRSSGPHFLITVRTATAGPTRAAARAGAADIASGYALMSSELRTRRLWWPRLSIATRWAPPGAFVLATAAELAALTGLPAEPSLHGLPAAAARSRPPAEGTWHTTTPPADVA